MYKRVYFGDRRRKEGYNTLVRKRKERVADDAQINMVEGRLVATVTGAIVARLLALGDSTKCRILQHMYEIPCSVWT